MAQFYFDESRESEPHALPDGEVFHHDSRDNVTFENGELSHYGMETGWYWWACFPGCLPDGDPMGPFATEAEALEDAREGVG